MNHFSIYVLLILIFLGLSKGFSPTEKKTNYIVNERVLSHVFKGEPLSLILLDSFQAGFLIKTYYLKVRMVRPFIRPDDIIVRTTKSFWEKSTPFLGMSIFRRSENGQDESIIPMPPGSLFIGDPGFGTWEYVDSGQKVWRFHKAYRDFNRHLNWGSFKADFSFYQSMKVHLKNSRPFYGPNQEFGKNGRITKKELTHTKDQTALRIQYLREHVQKFISIPSWSSPSLKVPHK